MFSQCNELYLICQPTRSHSISYINVYILISYINVLNRVSEHDSLTFFVLHRTKCKPMHFEQGYGQGQGQGQGQGLGLGFTVRVQGQGQGYGLGLGLGFRVRVQGQGQGQGLGFRVRGQGLGLGLGLGLWFRVRFRVRGYGQGYMVILSVIRSYVHTVGPLYGCLQLYCVFVLLLYVIF